MLFTKMIKICVSMYKDHLQLGLFAL